MPSSTKSKRGPAGGSSSKANSTVGMIDTNPGLERSILGNGTSNWSAHTAGTGSLKETKELIADMKPGTHIAFSSSNPAVVYIVTNPEVFKSGALLGQQQPSQASKKDE